MLPEPLHPAIVHLPIALAVLLPFAAIALTLAIARQWLPARSWALIVALHLLLAGGGLLAARTGEAEEERVERVVSERRIEAHEERAESFVWIAGLTILVTGAGLAAGRTGSIARAAAVVASLGVLAAGIGVGHSGGELVYQHGAASAYTAKATPDVASSGSAQTPRAGSARDRDEDDD